MKSNVLLLGTVIAAFTFTSFAADALLSPRAQGNQIKTVTGVAASQPTPANTVALTPRAQANQIKVVTGAANDSNPALDCRNGMAGSPKIVAVCSAHTTMPGCQTVASVK